MDWEASTNTKTPFSWAVDTMRRRSALAPSADCTEEIATRAAPRVASSAILSESERLSSSPSTVTSRPKRRWASQGRRFERYSRSATITRPGESCAATVAAAATTEGTRATSDDAQPSKAATAALVAFASTSHVFQSASPDSQLRIASLRASVPPDVGTPCVGVSKYASPPRAANSLPRDPSIELHLLHAFWASTLYRPQDGIVDGYGSHGLGYRDHKLLIVANAGHEMKDLGGQVSPYPTVDLRPVQPVGKGDPRGRDDVQTMVVHIELDYPLRAKNLQPRVDRGGHVRRYGPPEVQGPNRSVLKFAGAEDGILRIHTSQRHNLGHRARVNSGNTLTGHPLDRVDVVNPEVEAYRTRPGKSLSHLSRREPRAGDVYGISDLPVGNSLRGIDVSRIESEDVAYHQPSTAPLLGLRYTASPLKGVGHRFLKEHRLACLQYSGGDLDVHSVWQGNSEGLDVPVVQQVLHIREVLRSVPLGDVEPYFGVGISDRHQLGRIALGISPCVQISHKPGSYNRDPQPIRHLRSPHRCRSHCQSSPERLRPRVLQGSLPRLRGRASLPPAPLP